MKDIQSQKIRSLLRITAINPFYDSDYIESKNNLLGFLVPFVEIAWENPETKLTNFRLKANKKEVLK